MDRTIFTVALAAALVAVAAPIPAQARYACAVKKTSDGFVSLRQGPSARAPAIAKMKPQELVGLLHPETDDVVKKGDWFFVRWYPGTRRTSDHIPDMDENKARSGWVHDRLIDCFEE